MPASLRKWYATAERREGGRYGMMPILGGAILLSRVVPYTSGKSSNPSVARKGELICDMGELQLALINNGSSRLDLPLLNITASPSIKFSAGGKQTEIALTATTRDKIQNISTTFVIIRSGGASIRLHAGKSAETLRFEVTLTRRKAGDPINEVSPPAIAFAWDPELIDPSQYARIVNAFGDLVRNSGGIGIERIRSEWVGIGFETVVKA